MDIQIPGFSSALVIVTALTCMPAAGLAGPAPEPSARVPSVDDASQILAFQSQHAINDGENAGLENLIVTRPPTAEHAVGLFTRVRSRQQYTTTLLQKLYDRSPTARGLIERIQQSNGTVVVQLGTCKGGRFRGCVVNVTGTLTARHIWIMVDAHANENSLLATIAHELQHAVEIVEHPEVFDVAGVVQLYRRLAFGACRDGLSEECETERALATERQVLTELNTHSARVKLDRMPSRLFPAALPSTAVRAEAAGVRSTSTEVLALIDEAQRDRRRFGTWSSASTSLTASSTSNSAIARSAT